MQQSAMNVLAWLSSLRLTAVALAVLIVGVFMNYRDGDASIWWLAVPFGALALNLLAALFVNRMFRRHGGLLVFHVCLLAVFVLGGVAHLMSLAARLEIAEGQAFDPSRLEVQRAGPWHPRNRLQGIHFVQDRIRVEYHPGLTRGRTSSTIRLSGFPPGATTQRFGDAVPFAVGGYRFYTTSNKGYAVVVSWFGDDGTRQTGAIHFPSFPVRDWKQIARWTPPAGNTLEMTLRLAKTVPDGKRWILDSREADGELAVARTGKPKVTLAQGQSIRLPGGRMRFEDIRMWMGYTVSYNPLLPWFLAAAVVGIGALGWHLWRKVEFETGVDPHVHNVDRCPPKRPVAHV